MAYNNYFPNYYPQAYQPQHDNGIIWVQGEAAARAFLTPAGRSVLLMDSESNTFYLKTTDASGMPQPLRIFDYTERTVQPTQIVESKEIDTSQFVTREELEERLSKLKPKAKVVKNESDL